MDNKEELSYLIAQVQDCGCDVTDVVEMIYVENNVLVGHLIANGVTIRGTGYWEWDTEDIYKCSNCGDKVHVKEVMGQPVWDYCPACGANMMPSAPKGE